jgi:hypothetical protein
MLHYSLRRCRASSHRDNLSHSTSQVPNGKQFWDGAGDVEVCGFTGGDNLDWSVLLRTQSFVPTLICSPNLTGIGVPRHSGSFKLLNVENN